MANKLELLPVGEIHADPHNPRERFPKEELDRLAESIDQVGILVPVVVYKDAGGYQLLDGERRWRCATMLGLEEVPAVVVDAPDEATRLKQMFNIHLVREQWQDIPTAHALKKLMEETGVNAPAELSSMTGISTEQIKRYIFALSLKGDVWRSVESGEVPLNYFYEVYKAFIQPLEAKRPQIFKKYGTDGLLEQFLAKRKSGAISDVVSVRDSKFIVRKAAEDASDGGGGPLDDTIERLINDAGLSVKDAYEETVMVSVELDKLDARSSNLVSAFQRLLEKAEGDRETIQQIRGIGASLIHKLQALI